MNLTKLLAACTITLAAIIFNSCSGSLKDQDGNIIRMVRIGDMVWMTENLNVSHFRNGDEIPEAKSPEEWARMGYEEKPAWCYGLNNTDNINKYGKLYNWYAVTDPRGLAPRGWHVATDDEWTKFIRLFGNEVQAALFMRGSESPETGKREPNNIIKFPPDGARDLNGIFINSGSHGFWWSATEGTSTDAWGRLLNYVYCNVYLINYNKKYGFSVRCIRN